MTAGILMPLVAQVAFEAEQAREAHALYWRALKTGGELNPKYPSGIDRLMLKLEAEGHVVVQCGARNFVENFEQKLAHF